MREDVSMDIQVLIEFLKDNKSDPYNFRKIRCFNSKSIVLA